MKRINVNAENSKMVNGRLFITGMKMQKLGKLLREHIIQGSTITFPGKGLMYEYNGPYSRA